MRLPHDSYTCLFCAERISYLVFALFWTAFVASNKPQKYLTGTNKVRLIMITGKKVSATTSLRIILLLFIQYGCVHLPSEIGRVGRNRISIISTYPDLQREIISQP